MLVKQSYVSYNNVLVTMTYFTRVILVRTKSPKPHAPKQVGKLEISAFEQQHADTAALRGANAHVAVSRNIAEAQKALMGAVSGDLHQPHHNASEVIASGKLSDTMAQLGTQPGQPTNTGGVKSFGPTPNKCPVCGESVFFMEQVEVDNLKYHKR
jgi:hypothetical protein